MTATHTARLVLATVDPQESARRCAERMARLRVRLAPTSGSEKRTNNKIIVAPSAEVI